jgi:hypothetical protein
MPFRDPVDILFLDIGDLALGRVHIYYDENNLEPRIDMWIGQDNIDAQLGVGPIETDPAAIIIDPSTAWPAASISLQSGELDDRGYAGIEMVGRINATDDPGNTNLDTPFVKVFGTKVPVIGGSAIGVGRFILGQGLRFVTEFTDRLVTLGDDGRHPFQLSADGNQNLRMDREGIQSVNNEVASTLKLNSLGGEVHAPTVVRLGAVSTDPHVKIDDNEVQAEDTGVAQTLQLNPDGGQVLAGGFPVTRRIATTRREVNGPTFTTTETVIDSVTAALVNGATYRIRWKVRVNPGTAGNDVQMAIREDNVSGTFIDAVAVDLPIINRTPFMFLEGEYTAVATGNKTFVGTGDRVAGSGANDTPIASAASKSFLYVDYIEG